ncbi:hypothetical protein BJ912DRAFT_1064095 [Pholiota molesta]|nr:hypothetical protein BJ912DRAFT_1064095 [Pholiota molesta]
MAVTAKLEDKRCASAVLAPAVAYTAHPSSLRRTAAVFVQSFVGVAAVPPGPGLIQLSVEPHPSSIEHRASSFFRHASCTIVVHAVSCIGYRASSIVSCPSSLEHRPSPIARRFMAQPIADGVCTDGL